ncbi:hypothetical protein F4802DRAFT_8766 [Xylaria palmicola]|nr:hypothetical protein F4802DRAFT_8766 [Xylaria palmicola]
MNRRDSRRVLIARETAREGRKCLFLASWGLLGRGGGPTESTVEMRCRRGLRAVRLSGGDDGGRLWGMARDGAGWVRLLSTAHLQACRGVVVFGWRREHSGLSTSSNEQQRTAMATSRLLDGTMGDGAWDGRTGSSGGRTGVQGCRWDCLGSLVCPCSAMLGRAIQLKIVHDRGGGRRAGYTAASLGRACCVHACI